jgi:peptide/nickel transport system substrate-binding protein
MKIQRWFAVVLVSSLLACTPAGPGSDQPADAVVIGIQTDVLSWNPFLVEDTTSSEILALIYPSLAVEQPDYSLHPPTFQPALAESWKFSEDGLALTITLRADAVWSDGVPVSSEDLLFSWRVLNSEEFGWIWEDLTASIDSIEALDARTVRYQFKHRHPYQLMNVNDGPIVPAHAWSDVPFGEWMDVDWSERLLSAGPYLLAQRTPNQEVVLERNPQYFRAGAPRVNRLIFRVVPDRTSLINQFLSGGIDLVNGVPPSDVARIQSNPELELHAFSDRSYSHICWNLRHPILADPLVRRAFATAIDRQALIDVVYDGFARPSIGPVLSTMWAFNAQLEPIGFDPAAATAMLAEAGWTDSDGDGVLDRDGAVLAFEILAPAESPVRQDVALMIERDLGRIGVRVTPRPLEWGSFMGAIDAGDFEAFVNRWIEPTKVDLAGIWRTAPEGSSTFNYGGFSNDEVDGLLDRVAAAAEFEDRKQMLDRIQEIIVAEQPYAFLVEHTRLVGLNSRVKGADINDASIFFNIDEWTIEQ